MPTRRAWLVVNGAILACGAVVAAVVLVRRGDPRYDDAREVASVLAQVDAEAPLAPDVSLPVASHAAPLTKPHVRVELGKEHLRIGGRIVVASPTDGATTFDPWKRRKYGSGAVLPVAQWARGVLDDAGVESRTVELAIDRGAPYGLVVETIASLGEAEFRAVLTLARRDDGALGVLRQTSLVGRPDASLRIDPSGARVETSERAAAVTCTWAQGTPASELVRCLKVQIPALTRERPDFIGLAASADTPFGELVALMDALTAGEVQFSFTTTALQ